MIILYQPPSTTQRKPYLPMPLLAVAALLQGEFDCEIVDGNLVSDAVGRIVALASEKKARAIGFTVMPGPQLHHAVPQAQQIKRALPQVPIIWGGYFPSQHAEVCLREDYIDFCVRGQGEQTLLELLRVLDRGGTFSSVAGLSYKENGSIRHNPPRPLIALDDLPDWPYHKVDMPRYLYASYLGRRVGAHQSSYGCPFACSFCAIVDLVKQRWLPQSAARLATIVASQQQQFGIDAIQFHDMDFFVSEARVQEFAERIIPLRLSWWALGRVDELMRYREGTWKVMKASGLKMIFCGAESGSDEVLQRMNKGGRMSVEQTLELAARMKGYGIVPEFSFVLGSPPDPVADIERTIAFIRRLKRLNPAIEVILYLYTPVPLAGTLYDEARALGFKFPETLAQWLSGDWRHFSQRRDTTNMPWLNPALRRRVRDFESVLNAWYPTVTDKNLTGFKRMVLRALGGWRYHTKFYHNPLELRAFHKFFGYQRPETTGF